MKNVEIKGIGQIELKKEDDQYVYCQNEFKIKNENVEFDLHFKDINKEILEQVNNVIANLSEVLKTNQKLILQDLENKGEVDYYLTEWKDEILTDEELEDLLSDTDPKETIEKRMLSKLKIVRVGIYTYAESDFITFDYAFGKEIDSGFRDDMLVVCLNSKFDLMSISNEG